MRIRAGRAPGLVIRDADLSRGPGYVCALDKEAEIRVWIVEFQVRPPPPSNPRGNVPRDISGRDLESRRKDIRRCETSFPLSPLKSLERFVRRKRSVDDWEYR